MRDMDEFIAIPHSPQVESLNAGVAASIVLYEAARQNISYLGLFQAIPTSDSPSDRTRPLADRMRPRTLDEFAGQEH